MAMLESGHKGPLDFPAMTVRRESEAFLAFRAPTVTPALLDPKVKREQRVHQDHGAVTANLDSGDSQEHRVSKDTQARQAEKARLETLVHPDGTDFPESQATLGLKEPKESGA